MQTTHVAQQRAKEEEEEDWLNFTRKRSREADELSLNDDDGN